MKVLDLFSGLGGFSQAFLDRGHDVIRYEVNPRFKDVPNTIIKDVWNLTPDDLKGADVILASPPCTHFSIAAVRWHWPSGKPSERTLEQIALVKHTIHIIIEADPVYWVLENPRGMLRHVLGPPVVTTYWAAWGMPYLKPTDLWGKLPMLEWSKPVTWVSLSEKDLRSPDAAKRALIPYAFSQALCEAIEDGTGWQTSIDAFTEASQ